MESLNIFVDRYMFLYGTLSAKEGERALEPNLFDFVVCNVCEEILKQIGQQVYYESDHLGYCFIVTFSERLSEKQCESDCIQACEDIQKNIRNVLHMNISFGISLMQSDCLNMNQAYTEAMQACEQSAYLSEGTCILSYADVAEVELPVWRISDGKKKCLLADLLQGNMESAKKFIDDIFADCLDIEEMRYSAMELIMLSAQHFVKVNNGKERSKYITENLKRIYEEKTRQEVLRVLKRAISSLAEKSKDEQLSRNERTARQIILYIEENYGKDLSLDTLSEYFRLSKTYINHLLKSHNKKSFLEVLQECRMVKAEELITEGRYRIYEIAEMVGYHDQSYFIKVFKKTYGSTPNSYKRV